MPKIKEGELTAVPIQKWEYTSSSQLSNRDMNEMGLAGWEIAHIDYSVRTIIYKRKLYGN